MSEVSVSYKTVLLDSSYRVIDVISWQRAISLLFQEKVEVVEDGTHEIRGVSLTIKIPKALRLLKVKYKKLKAAFSKRGVFLRDDCKCAYCGKEFGIKSLTIDHVTPRCKGGQNSWMNVVSACRECNNKKGGRTPEEARMKLLFSPRVPTSTELLRKSLKALVGDSPWVK